MATTGMSTAGMASSGTGMTGGRTTVVTDPVF
jgi:hypothetical protein